MKKEVGICRYCGNEKPFCDAHIIPKSFLNLKKVGKYIGVHTNGTKDLTSFQNGEKDSNILCDGCDGLLGEYDRYAKEILFDTIPKNRRFETPLFLLTQPNFDYYKLRMFFISLVWRASISKKKVVNLGKYEDIALKILKNELPDNPDLFHPIIFRRPDNFRLSDLCLITTGKYSGQYQSVFTFPRYYIPIITNIRPIRNDRTLLKMTFNNREFPVFETDEDFHDVGQIIEIIMKKHLENRAKAVKLSL